MQSNFINPIVKSCVNTLAAMSKLELESGKPRVKAKDEPVTGANVTGLIDMVDGEDRASIAITFTKSVILSIANRTLPEPKQEVDGTIIDLVGEFSNVILGGAKGALEEEGYHFQLSLPVMIVGSDYLIGHKTKSTIIHVPFSTKEGDFYIDVSFDRVSPPRPPKPAKPPSSNEPEIF